VQKHERNLIWLFASRKNMNGIDLNLFCLAKTQFLFCAYNNKIIMNKPQSGSIPINLTFDLSDSELCGCSIRNQGVKEVGLFLF
jgi:hypothetical protein